MCFNYQHLVCRVEILQNNHCCLSNNKISEILPCIWALKSHISSKPFILNILMSYLFWKLFDQGRWWQWKNDVRSWFKAARNFVFTLHSNWTLPHTTASKQKWRVVLKSSKCSKAEVLIVSGSPAIHPNLLPATYHMNGDASTDFKTLYCA